MYLSNLPGIPEVNASLVVLGYQKQMYPSSLPGMQEYMNLSRHSGIPVANVSFWSTRGPRSTRIYLVYLGPRSTCTYLVYLGPQRYMFLSSLPGIPGAFVSALPGRGNQGGEEKYLCTSQCNVLYLVG